MKPPLAFILLLVALAVASAAPEKKMERERLVIVSATEFSLGAKRFTSLDDLKTELEIRVKVQPSFALLIVPGSQTSLGLTIIVLDACRRVGVSDIKVEGAPADPPRPNQTPRPTRLLGPSATEPPRVPSTRVAQL